VSYRSRFDQAFMQADDMTPPPDPTQVLTQRELDGHALFEGLNCQACHRTHAHTLDFPANNGLDVVLTDPGIDGAFRAASLRNIAVSAPYMHDGRFATLRDVINHYDTGVQDSPDLDGSLRENTNGAPRRLGLTDDQKDALEAFLHVLTDDALLTDPKFSDPFQ
jgi:cytochrome c peroxidase